MREPATDCKNINNARYGILTKALMKCLFFLAYDAACLGISVPAFRRNLLSPLSE